MAGERILNGALVWLVIASLLIVGGRARYFGGYYQDPAAPAPVDPLDLGVVDGGLDDGALTPNDGYGEVPIVDSNELGQNKLFYISNHAVEDPEWTQATEKSLSNLGNIAGVAASQDFLYLFHRGNVTWNDNSFNIETNVYNHQNEPIPVDTVVAVDLVSGEVMFSWGKQSFYMPHGISVDPQGNIWLTDVALHQAFRYKKSNFVAPDLVLGEKFIPGSDEKHFCKPTDVAVASSGVVYISDGYCNSRIVIFSAAGKFLTEIGHNDKMLIPHSLTLLEIEDLICAADRENGRILCYNAGLTSYRAAGQLLFEVSNSQLHKIYAIAHLGDIILALNGGDDQSVGVSVDLATEQVVDMWSPKNGSFIGAHDLATHQNGKCFYVAQFGGKDGKGSKVVKFDLVETVPKFMN